MTANGALTAMKGWEKEEKNARGEGKFRLHGKGHEAVILGDVAF